MLVTVIGAGPAGSAAALAALREGAAVAVCEKSRFPRHKVCGEFLSAEILEVLEQLGVAEAFLSMRPPRVRRARLFLGGRRKEWDLGEPAYGLSRYALDDLLLRTAVERGAELRREAAISIPPPVIQATGRHAQSVRGRRLFGYKAHFRGPQNDSIDLHFFRGGYAGTSAIEDGLVNVCGLAPEELLREHGFDIDAVVRLSPSLRERLGELERAMEWLVTGPLVFGGRFDEEQQPGVYLAGDALGFVDPFTGTGVLCGLITGRLAGRAASLGLSAREHARSCRAALRKQYAAAGLLRNAIASGWADRLAAFVPGPLLYRFTRPDLGPVRALARA